MNGNLGERGPVTAVAIPADHHDQSILSEMCYLSYSVALSSLMWGFWSRVVQCRGSVWRHVQPILIKCIGLVSQSAEVVEISALYLNSFPHECD